MNKYITLGKIKKIEGIQTEKTTYLKIELERSFINKDNELKTITEYITSFNEYDINMYKQKLLKNGNAIYAECTITPNVYKKGEEYKPVLNLVATYISNINIKDCVEEINLDNDINNLKSSTNNTDNNTKNTTF